MLRLQQYDERRRLATASTVTTTLTTFHFILPYLLGTHALLSLLKILKLNYFPFLISNITGKCVCFYFLLSQGWRRINFGDGFLSLSAPFSFWVSFIPLFCPSFFLLQLTPSSPRYRKTGNVLGSFLLFPKSIFFLIDLYFK